MKRIALTTVAILLVVAASAPARAQQSAAMTLIVHGIAGPPPNPTAPLDILVDGSMCLGAFEFGDIQGPYPFEARIHDVTLSPASASEPCSLRPILRTTVTFDPGEITALVAFVNVTNRSVRFEKFAVKRPAARLAGDGIVSLHHLVVSPPLDFMLETHYDPDYGDDDDDDDDASAILWAEDGIQADIDDDAVIIHDMFNGDHVNAAVPSGGYAASVSPAGTSARIIEPVMVDVEANTVKFLFAIGSMRGRAVRVVEFNWTMDAATIEAIAAESDDE